MGTGDAYRISEGKASASQSHPKLSDKENKQNEAMHKDAEKPEQRKR
jgi:hypothetical protein